MPKRSGILVGTAGVYHVASQLAQQGFHAAVTFGNAPSVDILVASQDGAATISLQVKTSHWALRTRGRGHNKQPHHYEWDVGEKSAKLNRQGLFFAFVDLKLGGPEAPEVFIVPSKQIREYFKRFETLSRWRWHPSVGEIEGYRNSWDTLRVRLNRADG
jgi:hypothetical protein